MSIRVGVVTGPAHWANTLVNGDQTNMTPLDTIEMNAWLETIKPAYIVSTVGDAEPRFTWSYKLYGGTCDGGEVIDYVTYEDT
jgi:hypothetical protein